MVFEGLQQIISERETVQPIVDRVEPEEAREPERIALEIKNLNVWYGHFQALRDVSFPVAANRITAIIGPSGCGKSTLIRCLNRMNDLVRSFRAEGEIQFEG